MAKTEMCSSETQPQLTLIVTVSASPRYQRHKGHEPLTGLNHTEDKLKVVECVFWNTKKGGGRYERIGIGQTSQAHWLSSFQISSDWSGTPTGWLLCFWNKMLRQGHLVIAYSSCHSSLHPIERFILPCTSHIVSTKERNDRNSGEQKQTARQPNANQVTFKNTRKNWPYCDINAVKAQFLWEDCWDRFSKRLHKKIQLHVDWRLWPMSMTMTLVPDKIFMMALQSREDNLTPAEAKL